MNCNVRAFGCSILEWGGGGGGGEMYVMKTGHIIIVDRIHLNVIQY